VAGLAIRQAMAFANRADLVIAPGPAVARVLRSRGVRTRLAIVPTGVPLPADAGKAPRRDYRRALGFGDSTPLCLSVGRLAREKNQSFLLSAFALILRDLPNARMILVGEGDDRPRLERSARALGIGGRVQFVGAVSHEAVGKYYLAADLFLFPSTSETQGIVVLEAMAAGLPVVAVESDAAADLMGTGGGGIFTPEAPAPFARSVVELWGQPERRQAMGAAGRKIAEGYSPEACAATLVDLYRELVRARQAVPAPGHVARPQEAKP
jgi:glycosyltransferase involved in cell wall biosynthesis